MSDTIAASNQSPDVYMKKMKGSKSKVIRSLGLFHANYCLHVNTTPTLSGIVKFYPCRLAALSVKLHSRLLLLLKARGDKCETCVIRPKLFGSHSLDNAKLIYCSS